MKPQNLKDQAPTSVAQLWLWSTFIPPISVVVNTQGRQSGGSWLETCSGVWYPRRRPCGVAINTLVDLINWLGNPQVWRSALHHHVYHSPTSSSLCNRDLPQGLADCRKVQQVLGNAAMTCRKDDSLPAHFLVHVQLPLPSLQRLCPLYWQLDPVDSAS